MIEVHEPFVKMRILQSRCPLSTQLPSADRNVKATRMSREFETLLTEGTVTQSFELKRKSRVSWMIRRAIRTGTTRMHRCTRGCVVLFRGTTGVGTHGLPTRSRVSDLTRRVIDAAISLAAVEVFMPPLHLAPPEMAGFVVFDDATVRIYPVRFAGARMPAGAGALRRRKRETGLAQVASGNLDRCWPDRNTADSCSIRPTS